jgi:hypothetical protein
MFKHAGSRKTIPDLTEEERKGMSEVAIMARELLRPFALVDYVPGKTWQRKEYVYGVGSQEGCCILLAASHFDMPDPSKSEESERDDKLNKGEMMNSTNYSHATLEAFRLVDNMMNFVSTALVVMSLTLTIAATLITTIDPSVGGNGDQSVAFIGQWLEASDLMFAFHVLESLFVALTALISSVGLYWGFFVYASIGIYCVSLESKLRFLMSHITMIAWIWGYVFGSLFFLPLSLVFIAARISPILALCCFMIPAGFIHAFLQSVTMGDYLCKDQHRSARDVFGIAHDAKLEQDYRL